MTVDATSAFESGGGTLVDETLGQSGLPHLVFLHGWGATRESLRGVGVLFQHAFRVHLIDLPGFGEAPAPPADWDTTRYADLVEAYVSQRLAGPFVLAGHSFGGRVALRLAARRPSPLRGLVLMGVPGLPVERWSRRAVRRAWIRSLRRMLVLLKPIAGSAPLGWHTSRYGSRDYLAAGHLRALLVRTVNEDLTATARAVGCPTLLLYGEDDTETPPELGHRYRRIIGERSALVVLPHKDHYLFTGTGSHLCAHLMRRWMPDVG